VVELLELRQDDFVTVLVDGEDLHRTPDDDVGAVAGFAFPEDERRGRELDELGDLGKRAELAGLEIAEQSYALEELFAFPCNHGHRRKRIYSKGTPDSLARSCKLTCRFVPPVACCLRTFISALVKYRP